MPFFLTRRRTPMQMYLLHQLNKKLAQANEKLSFIGKYVSSNPIDVLYTLNYAGFTTSLYMLSIAFSIAVDAGLSINTATLLAVSTVLKRSDPILSSTSCY